MYLCRPSSVFGGIAEDYSLVAADSHWNRPAVSPFFHLRMNRELEITAGGNVQPISAMAPTSNVPTSIVDDLRLSFINRTLQNLRNTYNLLLQKEKSLNRKGIFLSMKRRKIRCSKSSVAGKIDMLEKLFKEFSSGEHSPSPLLVTANAKEVYAADPSTSSAKRGRGVAAGQLQTPKSRRLDDMVRAQENESVGLYKAELRSSMNENETKEPRYLLVSNGCVICCLDLQQSKGESIGNAFHVPRLPKIATLMLLEEGLPVSVGLFKLGPDAYMIGGQKHPALSEVFPVRAIKAWDLFCNKGRGGEDPRGYNLYRALCSIYDVKGTSRVTYRLSLANDGTLSRSKCNIGKLNKPKFWPIVEKIKGQIHVIDSVPCAFDYHATRDWIFSHETLINCDGRCYSWMEIPTLDEQVFIRTHLVVGDRIYGVDGQKCVVFDSKTNEWEVHPGINWSNPLSTKKVWHIIGVGIARCAGEFPLRGEASDPLYVVIAVVRSAPWVEHGNATFAVAYLVTSTGEVVCIQRLRRFFKKPVKPWFFRDGTMLDVDEEGKTICAIFNASAIFNGDEVDSDYLFINTFSVEMLSEAASKVLEIHAKGSKAWPVKQEFVRVDMKQRHIFKTDAEREDEGDLPGFPGVQACFM